MELKNLKFLKLMPRFMQNDECVKALCKSVDEIFRPTADDIKKLSDWDRIDIMTDSELDELAWECNITWYDKNASLDVKRRLCKNSDKIFMKRATTAAVEEVLSTYFSEAKLLEFWDANLDPHYFKIQTSTIISDDKMKDFLSILEKTKRKSQWLKSLIYLFTENEKFYMSLITTNHFDYEFDCTEAF